MSRGLTRRDGLKLTLSGLGVGAASRAQASVRGQWRAPWADRFDRVWLGGDVWANPMEDWRIEDGMACCGSSGGNRSVHSLVHQIDRQVGEFEIRARVVRTGGAKVGGAAIRLGARSDIGDYRSNCFVEHGYDAGVLADCMVLGGLSLPVDPAATATPCDFLLTAKPRAGRLAISFVVKSAASGKILGALEDVVELERIAGNVALVSNFSVTSDGIGGDANSLYAFSDWTIAGLDLNPKRRFGPILWAMYTLGQTRGEEGSVLKLSVITGPMGEADSPEVELEVLRDGRWLPMGAATLDREAWVATFRLPDWDAGSAAPFRLTYRERLRSGGERVDRFTGIVRAEPRGRPLRMAALTCQNDYAFPYAPVADNVVKLDPDLVLFSGDQIYENHGGFGLVRSPDDRAIHNYLRKFYQFGWAFRDAMRDRPTICLPDDHDVLQGNIWGEAGAQMSAAAVATGRSDMAGGYIEPARVVNAIHRTNVSHLPDPVDPVPVLQGISTYHTELLFGGVSFAILADRMWKSGPERLGIVVGETGKDETPTFVNPALDRADLQLLGDRQERFLAQWAEDWRGHALKAVLSQTVFAGIATHQPTPDNYLKYDFDSSGWPRSGRDRAVRLMRSAAALHICGDTHLGSLSQYGVDRQRDANWAFCTPAIAAGWPRWWNPDRAGLPVGNRPSHHLADTGEYRDSFGNPIYVYAVGNPDIGTASNRYLKAHQKGSGFGFVEFDAAAKRYAVHAYRFLADLREPSAGQQFPGWPVIIQQDENKGLVNRLA